MGINLWGIRDKFVRFTFKDYYTNKSGLKKSTYKRYYGVIFGEECDDLRKVVYFNKTTLIWKIMYARKRSIINKKIFSEKDIIRWELVYGKLRDV